MNAIERIISAIPAEAGFTDADRADAHRLLLSCVLWALPGHGPRRDGIDGLRGLGTGFGNRLDHVREGINLAALTSNERGFFLGALGVATALLLSLSTPVQKSEAPPSRSGKRSGRKDTKTTFPHSVRQTNEIVLPPEWRS